METKNKTGGFAPPKKGAYIVNIEKVYNRYMECNDLKDATHLEISVFYTKGGISCFSSDTIRRGYYIRVRPVTLNNYSIGCKLFDGYEQLLLETERYSTKQFDIAIEMSKDYVDELVAIVVKG